MYQILGFLGTEGEVPTIDGADLKLPGGTKVGVVIKIGDTVVGFRKLDGSAACFNLQTTAKFVDAWNAVKNGGTLFVYTHGNEQGGGTFLELDKRKQFAGVRKAGAMGGGTGKPDMDVYDLPPREGAEITVTLRSCFSAKDPDGALPALTSVVDTFKTIPGVNVNAVTGAEGTYTVSTCFDYEAPPGGANALKSCARFYNDRNDDVGEWVSKTFFPEQRSRFVGCLMNAKKPPTKAKFFYREGAGDVSCSGPRPDMPDGGIDGSGYYIPSQSWGPAGGQMTFAPPESDLWIDLMMPMAAVAQPTGFLLCAAALDPATSRPCGTAPASLVAHVAIPSGESLPPFANPAVLTLAYGCPDSQIAGFFRIVGSSLLAYPTVSMAGGIVTAEIFEPGMYVLMRTTSLAERADIVPDLVIDGADLGELLSVWNQPGGPGNFNCDNFVDAADLGLLLNNWGDISGPACPD